MKKLVNALFLVTLAIALVTMSSCKKEISNKKAIGPEFNLDKFETELKASIQGSGAIGWTYVISQNGLFKRGGGFGKARNTADGDLNMTINKKINIASVSKFLTTIAAMQLIERRGLTVNASILPWLPPSWKPGPGVAFLTFADLLGHTSGLSSANTLFSKTLGYAGLKRMVDTGVVRTNDYRYLNANFALFRILIPSLWKGLDDAPAISSNLDSATTETIYQEYMQAKVFNAIGLNNINCEPESRANSILYYATTDGQINNGNYYGSYSAIAGGGGHSMTTFELATVLAYFQHTNVLLSPESRDLMKSRRFGMDRQDISYEQHGLYYGKNGSISSSGQGTYEQITMFPNGVEAVVMFNTQGMVFAGGETFIGRAIFDAYNKAWN